MAVKESVVNIHIMEGACLNPPFGCPIRPGLLMEDPDAKYELRGDVMVTTLPTNVEAWLCKHTIMVVDMS